MRRSGILIHPSSLPNEGPCGDLGPSSYRFLDWLEDSGTTLWQVLPLHPPGGGFYTDEIQYVDISTPGNATDSGDLVYASGEPVAGSHNATDGFRSGGYNSGTPQNYIQKSVLATGANATDYGDLLSATFVCTGTSGNAA